MNASSPSAAKPPSAETEAERKVRQAARADGDPALMRELAADANLLVRASLAINPSCSPEVDEILAGDGDDRVRSLLATRIAQLLPGLHRDDRAIAAQHVRSVLMRLARDEAVRVRSTLANETSTMPAAPHELVLLLAQDCCVEVSGSLLRLSPVLTDTDLLQLLATPPFPSSAALIASRAQLSAAVADAVVAYADAPAIRVLLANASACIQEATLDALVGRAPLHEDWHAPLVRRPNLSAKAVQSLSEFIAADLLRVLASRDDLEPRQLEGVRRRMAHAADPSDDKALLAEALRLKAKGGLIEEVILGAAQAGQSRRLAALIAVASNMPLKCVDRAVEIRSAKALVTLSWLAGLSMRAATIVQSHLGQIDPDYILGPSPTGDYPLSREEIEWQVELIRESEDASDPVMFAL